MTDHRSLITDHFFGGVAERLIAPVLKTGRPKGLVSSNLTPSAFDLLILVGMFFVTCGVIALADVRIGQFRNIDLQVCAPGAVALRCTARHSGFQNPLGTHAASLCSDRSDQQASKDRTNEMFQQRPKDSAA